MSKRTLRQKVRSVFRSDEEKVLIEQGFTYPSGALTKEGRKVVLDHLFQRDESLYGQIVDVARQLANT